MTGDGLKREHPKRRPGHDRRGKATERLNLLPRYRRTLEALLRKHLPGVEAWAYGSRVNGRSHEGSDLDLVLREPELNEIPAGQLSKFEEAVRESNIPFLVEARDWARLPERFHGEIERDHVVLAETEDSDGLWCETMLGEVIELKRGYDLPQRERIDGNIPVVSSSGVIGRHRESKVTGPGVVTGRYGTLGQVFFIADDFWPLNTALYVQDFKDNDPRFISYLLKALDVSKYADKAAVPGLNRNHLHQETVRVPSSIVEQRAIAHILGTLDDKVELNRRMNETLEAMARALFKSWFVDFAPVRAKMAGHWQRGESLLGLPAEYYDIFPDRLVATALGQIPQGWDVKALGELVDVVGGTTPSTKVIEYWSGGTHCWATPKDLSALSTSVLLDTERKITDAGLDRIGSGLLPPGTLLLSSRAPIGYLAISEEPVAINQGFIAMPPCKRVSNLFLLHWCNAFRGEIVRHANGSTFLEISKGNFRRIPMSIATEEVMDEFERQARPLHQRIVANEREVESLAVQRDALLLKLVSGEVRVNRWR